MEHSARPEAEALTQYRIQHADTEYTHTYHIGKCVWPCALPSRSPSNAHPRARAERSAHHSHLTPVLEVPNSSALSVTRTPYTQCNGNPRRLRTRHNHKAHYVKHSPPSSLPCQATRAAGARAVSADDSLPGDSLLHALPYLPEQCRRCTPKPEAVSKERPHASQGNCPKASSRTGPVAPARKREAQAAQSVRAPAGPGPLPLVSWAWHSHQLQRHAPPSQSRECTPSARNVSKERSHRSHG
jgi:hypothetical protein